MYKNMGKRRGRLRAFTGRHESKGDVNGTNYMDEPQNLQAAERGERISLFINKPYFLK